jgi:tryptophan-rich sensory protein
MDIRSLLIAIALCAAMAVLGTILAGRSWRPWYDALRKPRLSVPLPAFALVAALVYALDGFTLYRLLSDRLPTSARAFCLAALVTVMLSNEIWNFAFLGRRSTAAGLVGVFIFMAPLALLVVALLSYERLAALLFLAYCAWVVYDATWMYGLWRLNPASSALAPNERGAVFNPPPPEAE